MRQRLYDYLQSRPGGAAPEELLDLVFVGGVRDPAFGLRFLDTMLGGDERFRFEPGARRWRASIHDVLAQPLAETSFVVVDVETTGLPAGPDTITEIGAVRVERGRLTEQFVSLVNPGRPIPRFVVQLTGITDAMVADAPSIAEVLPRFVEFVGQRPLVAHNAKFDLCHLDAAAELVLGRPLGVPVVCTLKLARRLRPQLRRRGLEAVAADLGIAFGGHHRALADARVAAEILCVFVEELARLGIGRLDQLVDFEANAADGRPFVVNIPRARLDDVPQEPGVYHLLGEDGRLLYVGRARRLRARLASYFTNARGHSPRTLDLIRQVFDFHVTTVGSELAAALLEAKRIRDLRPPHNRLRRHLPRVGFVKLAQQATYPRLWVTQRLAPDRATYIGPFPSRQVAERAESMLARVFGLRTCTPPLRPAPEVEPCALGVAGTCPAPCAARIDATTYRRHAERLVAFLEGHDETPLADLTRRRADLAAGGHVEQAEAVRRDIELLETIRQRQRSLSWVLTRQNFVVLLPTVDRSAAQLYAVLGGRLAFEARIEAATDLLAAVDVVRERFAAFQRAPLAREHVEGATIIAAWLRDRGREGLLLPLTHPDELAERLDELVVTVDDLRQRGPLPAIDGLV